MSVCRFRLEVKREMNTQTLDMVVGAGRGLWWGQGEGCGGEDNDKGGARAVSRAGQQRK